MQYRISDCFWIEDDDYMKKLLDMWQEREDATVGQLMNFLERIDRYDVIDDCIEMFGACCSSKLRLRLFVCVVLHLCLCYSRRR